MRSIKVVGLALFASLAISMVASASASATVGIFECVLGVGTSNLGSNCLTLAGGTYTVKEIVGAKFTSKATSTTVLTAGTKKIECTGATNEGVITSLTKDRATIKFVGCEEKPSDAKCETSGSGSGNITAPVNSEIVSYLNSSSELRAGLLLAPVNSAGENKLEFECVGTKVKVYGSVIGAITPESTTKLSFTVNFALKTSGEQEIPESSNSLRAKFGSSVTEKATQKGEALLDFTLEVEIMG
jgi:hypothetical protein